MAVVVEASAFAGAFFIWYNIPIHHRQELRGYLIALFYICYFYR
nr:MAG TPA: hypothetical protein [Caudoviricetes sp.]